MCSPASLRRTNAAAAGAGGVSPVDDAANPLLAQATGGSGPDWDEIGRLLKTQATAPEQLVSVCRLLLR